MPKTEIEALKQGKEIKVDTQTAQLLILNDMRKNMELLSQWMIEVKTSIDSTIPDGIYLEDTFNITAEYTPIYFHGREDLYPIHDFYIFNDGPDEIYLIVNDGFVPKTPIKRGEDLHVDMKAKKIHKIIIYCNGGETAVVRIHATK